MHRQGHHAGASSEQMECVPIHSLRGPTRPMPQGARGSSTMNRDLINLLRCPIDAMGLDLITDESQFNVKEGNFSCRHDAKHSFPISDGIPDFRISSVDHVSEEMDQTYGTRVTKAVARTVMRLPGNWILDAGCGRAAYAPLIGGRYVGVDIVRPFLVEASAKSSDGDFIAADILALPFADDSVDCVIASQVIEHFDPVRLPQAISEMKRVVKHSIVVDTPNESTLMHNLRRIVYRNRDVHSDHSPLEHQSALTPKHLRALGFQVHGCIGHVTRDRFRLPLLWDVFDAAAWRFPAIAGNLIGIDRVIKEEPRE
jgi:SAM-dependent methyltransferase